jgi:hypothetical protein
MVELDTVIDNMHTSLFSILPYVIYLEENYKSLTKLDQIRNMYGKQQSNGRVNFEYINTQIYHVLQIIGQFEEQIKYRYDINYFVGMLRLYSDSELISTFYNLIININAKKSAYAFINLYNPSNSNNIKKCDILISKYTEFINLLSLDLDIASIPQFKPIPLREAYETIEMSDQQLEQLYNVLKEHTIQLARNNNRESFNTIIDNLGRMSYMEKLL